MQNGFLEGLRGKGGGYRLTRSPDPVHRGRDPDADRGQPGAGELPDPNGPPCSRMANCRTYERWKGLDDLISNYFGNITLADLARPDQAGNDYDLTVFSDNMQKGRTGLTGAPFCTVLGEYVQFFLSRITVDGLGLLRYTLPLMCPFTLLIEERGTLLRNIFFSSRAFLRFVFGRDPSCSAAAAGPGQRLRSGAAAGSAELQAGKAGRCERGGNLSHRHLPACCSCPLPPV